MAVTDRASTGKEAAAQRAGSPGGVVQTGAYAGRRKKNLIAALLLVVLLGAGGGAFVLLTGSGADAVEAAEVGPEPGAVVPLDAITINLADGRYLQVSIALQQALVEGESEELDGSRALHILISTLSGKSVADLTTHDQREAIRSDLVASISDAYHDEVYDVYFTSFVMQ